MITLITGLPRHGKTLYSIHMMMNEYKDREKYVSNYSEIDYEVTNTKEWEVKNWQDLPDGSVFFIDEAWQYFEVRQSSKLTPEVIKQLALHGHKGLDIVLVTQGPSQLDAFVRTLVDRHIHAIRPFGHGYTRLLEFQGLEMYPGDKRARARALDVKRWKFNKKLYDYYKSASAHTVKRKIPVKLIMGVAVILAFFFTFFLLVSWFMKMADDSESVGMLGGGVEALTETIGIDKKSINTVESYNQNNIPLIEGLPWTAPKYSELRQPTQYPKPRCIRFEVGSHGYKCQCYSQQSTKMQMNAQACNYYVDNGYFDDTLPEKNSENTNLNQIENNIMNDINEDGIKLIPRHLNPELYDFDKHIAKSE